jgi:hypothetical protein
MPIKVAAAPKRALRLLQTGTEKLLEAGLVDATLGRIEGLASPQRVFHLGLDALVGEQPVAKAAKHVGWLAQLVDAKKEAVAAAELVLTREGLEFACVNRGPHATGGRAGQAAERWSRRSKDDHELAVLRVPGAYCTAFWLRSHDGSQDAFVPIAPCPPNLKPDQAYGEQEFRAALLPEARKQLEGPSEPTGGRKRR